jgi:hypothetical protein
LRTATSDADFWVRLRQAMGQDGLLTYRYLGRRTRDMYDVPHDSMAIRRDMRNAAGGLAAAPLAIATAEAGGFTDFDALPAPVMYGLTLLDPGHDLREVRMEREILHQGRSMGFSRTVVTDADNPHRIIAVSHGIGIKLAEAPEQGGTLFELPQAVVDSPDLPPLTEVFGGRRAAEGWMLPELSEGLTSTSGSLHLGPIHVILEAAATELAAARAGTERLQVTGWEVSFVARGAVGPFLASGEALGGPEGVVCRLLLRDRGKADRIVASAIATFRPA